MYALATLDLRHSTSVSTDIQEAHVWIYSRNGCEGRNEQGVCVFGYGRAISLFSVCVPYIYPLLNRVHYVVLI